MKFSIGTDLGWGHLEQPCLIPPHETLPGMNTLGSLDIPLSCMKNRSALGNHTMFPLETICKTAAGLCWQPHEMWCHVLWWPLIRYLYFHFWQLCLQAVPTEKKIEKKRKRSLNSLNTLFIVGLFFRLSYKESDIQTVKWAWILFPEKTQSSRVLGQERSFQMMVN